MGHGPLAKIARLEGFRTTVFKMKKHCVGSNADLIRQGVFPSCLSVTRFGSDSLSRQLAVNPSMGARWRHPCRQRLAQKAISPSLTGSMTAQAVLFRGWGHTRMATQTEYKEGSSLLGRVLKRLCSHMYCSGAWRTAASMTRLLRLASRWSSPLGKSASGASMTNR